MAQDPEGESDQLDLTAEQLVSRLYAEAELSYRKGRSLDDIREGIVRAGIHEEDADQMVETLSEFLLQKQSDKARRNVFYGMLWLLGSIGGAAAIFTGKLSLGAWLAAIVGAALGITLLARGIMQWRAPDAAMSQGSGTDDPQ
ncbi:MAG: hypothetical protein VB855_08850 [Pirellulaceae bacterium]